MVGVKNRISVRSDTWLACTVLLGVVCDVPVLCSSCLCIGYVGAIPHWPSYIVVRHRRHERSGVIRGDHNAPGLAGVLDNIPNHIP